MRRFSSWISNWCCFIIVALVFTQAAEAEDGRPAVAPNEQPTHFLKQTRRYQLDLSLSAGVRLDQLRWNTAALNNDPNILSELEWRDVLSYQITARGCFSVEGRFYGRGHFNYARIQDGTVQDSDYGGNDRTQEWSRSISETNGDQLWDVVAGVGYPFTFQRKRLLVAPLLGVSLHKQNLRITNGRQTLSGTPPPGYDPPPPVGPLNNQLNSLYSARWDSLWTGCDLSYQINTARPMEVGVSLAYHFWADYDAKADWNLRDDLQHPISFEHDADARGISLQARWLMRLNSQWNLHFNLDYARWTSDSGVATIYHTPPAPNQTTRLNEVNWESHSVSVGVTYRFF